MKKSVLRSGLLTTLFAGGALMLWSAANDPTRAAVYAGLPADAFLKNWFVLGDTA